LKLLQNWTNFRCVFKDAGDFVQSIRVPVAFFVFYHNGCNTE
jgi:hypothetical protein